MVVRHCQEICGCHFRINLQRRREAFCLAKRASTRLIYTKERFAPRGRTVVVTASLCPRRRSVEFCDDCPHFRLLSSSTGGSRWKCSRTNAKRGLAREKLDFAAKTKEPWVKTQGSFVGGEGEIRTLEPCYGLHDFQSCALDQLGDFSISYLPKQYNISFFKNQGVFGNF